MEIPDFKGAVIPESAGELHLAPRYSGVLKSRNNILIRARQRNVFSLIAQDGGFPGFDDQLALNSVTISVRAAAEPENREESCQHEAHRFK